MAGEKEGGEKRKQRDGDREIERERGSGSVQLCECMKQSGQCRGATHTSRGRPVEVLSPHISINK